MDRRPGRASTSRLTGLVDPVGRRAAEGLLDRDRRRLGLGKHHKLACSRRLLIMNRDPASRSHIPTDNSTFLRGVVPTDHSGTGPSAISCSSFTHFTDPYRLSSGRQLPLTLCIPVGILVG